MQEVSKESGLESEEFRDSKPMPMLPSWLTSDLQWLSIAPVSLAIFWAINAVQSLLSFVVIQGNYNGISEAVPSTTPLLYRALPFVYAPSVQIDGGLFGYIASTYYPLWPILWGVLLLTVIWQVYGWLAPKLLKHPKAFIGKTSIWAGFSFLGLAWLFKAELWLETVNKDERTIDITAVITIFITSAAFFAAVGTVRRLRLMSPSISHRFSFEIAGIKLFAIASSIAVLWSITLSWRFLGEHNNDQAFGISNRYDPPVERLLIFSELPLEIGARAYHPLALATGGSRDIGYETISISTSVVHDQFPISPFYLLFLLAVPLATLLWTRWVLRKNSVTPSQAIKRSVSIALGFTAAYALLGFASIESFSYQLDNWLLNNFIALVSCSLGALAAGLLHKRSKPEKQDISLEIATPLTS